VDDGTTTGVDTDAKVADDGKTTGVDAEVADDERNSQAKLDSEMQAKYGPRNDRYDMRQRREPDYSHLFANSH
jgi:hypothetical protein